MTLLPACQQARPTPNRRNAIREPSRESHAPVPVSRQSRSLSGTLFHRPVTTPRPAHASHALRGTADGVACVSTLAVPAPGLLRCTPVRRPGAGRLLRRGVAAPTPGGRCGAVGAGVRPADVPGRVELSPGGSSPWLTLSSPTTPDLEAVQLLGRASAHGDAHRVHAARHGSPSVRPVTHAHTAATQPRHAPCMAATHTCGSVRRYVKSLMREAGLETR